MIRTLAAAAMAAVLAAHMAAASPSPSPSLDTILAEPQASDAVPESQFVPALQGKFEPVDLLAFWAPTKPSQWLATLENDGFVAGYGRSWAQRSSNHFLLEAVVAFRGAAGAVRWLPEARSLDQNGQYFNRSFSVTGIDPQFGDHFVNPTAPAYADMVAFVKGNDFFIVYMLSLKDDLVDTVARQARQQFDIAPAGTIPPSQWPENAANTPATTPLTANATAAILFGAAGAVVVVLVAVALVLVVRGGRKPAPNPAAAAIQMSPDGSYWWDGMAWRDASLSAPPGAQRSADGHYWWDGTKWRTAPTAPS